MTLKPWPSMKPGAYITYYDPSYVDVELEWLELPHSFLTSSDLHKLAKAGIDLHQQRISKIIGKLHPAAAPQTYKVPIQVDVESHPMDVFTYTPGIEQKWLPSQMKVKVRFSASVPGPVANALYGLNNPF